MTFRTLLKAFNIVLALTAAACVGGLAIVLWTYRDIPAAVLEAEYGTPKSLVEGILRNVAGDPDSIPDDVIDQWYRFNMRAGQREAEIARNAQFTVGHTTEELNAITAPTLLMWGEANSNLPLSQLDEFKMRLEKAPVSVVTYLRALAIT